MKKLIESLVVNWKFHLLAALFTALLFTKRKMIEKEEAEKARQEQQKKLMMSLPEEEGERAE